MVPFFRPGGAIPTGPYKGDTMTSRIPARGRAMRRRLGALIPALFLSSPCLLARAQEFPAPAIHRGEPFNGTTVTDWDYDLDGDLKPELRKQDIDGDGVADRYLKDRDANGLFDLTVSKAPRAGHAQRLIIICVDGVPFPAMERLWRAGHFMDFFPPGRVISPFPSAVNPSLAEVFGMARPAGIEDLYYDRAAKRLAGGAWDRATRRADHGTFREAFDWDAGARDGALARLFPGADLARCRDAFWRIYREKPAGEPIVLSIGAAPDIVRRLLEIERLIDEIVFHAAGDVRITLFSPRGVSPAAGAKTIDLARHLGRKGFRLAPALKGPRDVVIPLPGPAGDLCIYTREENREAVAKALAALKGVDFSAYVTGDACVVEGPLGRARITRNGTRYRYEPVSGDPLRLGPVLAALQRGGRIDADGYADDADWLAATRAHAYPDILRRLAGAVTDHVVNRPDVFVSLAEGFSAGGGILGKMGGFAGIHGSAAEAQTIGVAMSTDRTMPPFVRAADLLAAIGEAKPGGADRAAAATTPAAETPTSAATPTITPTIRMSPTPSASPTPTPTATPTQPSPTPTSSATPAVPTVTPAPTASAATPPAVTPRPSPRPTRTRRPVVRALRRTPLPRRSPLPARPAAPGNNAPK